MNTLTNNIRSGPTFSNKIDRHEWSQLGTDRYVREYVYPLKPAIITGALEHWAAKDKWTFDFFETRYGNLPLELEERSLSMAELIKKVRSSTPQAPAPYLRNYPVKSLPEALHADIAPMPLCTAPNWLDHPLMRMRASLTFPELYIGGEGAKFPVLHYDGLHTHAFLMQLQGVKEYIAFAPDQAPYMYVRAGDLNISEISDMDNFDPQRFPLFNNATGFRFLLHPGETLFIPSGWWHTARILSPSITVSINGANRANWYNFRKDFCRDYAQGRKLPPWFYNAYLLFVGKWLDPFASI